MAFELKEGGWVNVSVPAQETNPSTEPISFVFRVDRPCKLELKFVYADGATFGCRAPIEPEKDAKAWRRITVFPEDAAYWWGGQGRRGALASFELGITGEPGKGSLWIAAMQRGPRAWLRPSVLPARARPLGRHPMCR